MREILFRGKRCDNGGWVEGFYIRADHHWHKHGIHKDWIALGASANGGWFALHNKYPVKGETVGQYTGLNDKNGQRIFEGDIGLLDDEKGVVNYGTGCFCVRLKGSDYLYRCNPAIDIVLNEYPGFEIIGNIHDNPELLEEVKCDA